MLILGMIPPILRRRFPPAKWRAKVAPMPLLGPPLRASMEGRGMRDPGRSTEFASAFSRLMAAAILKRQGRPVGSTSGRRPSRPPHPSGKGSASLPVSRRTLPLVTTRSGTLFRRRSMHSTSAWLGRRAERRCARRAHEVLRADPLGPGCRLRLGAGRGTIRLAYRTCGPGCTTRARGRYWRTTPRALKEGPSTSLISNLGRARPSRGSRALCSFLLQEVDKG